MVCVISNTGMKLMPTTEYRARRLLKKGKAVIHKYRPFTIQLTDRSDGNTQPVEYKCDTGYSHVGISICTEKRQLFSAQYDLLKGEKERHDDCRKYRRTRRNRLRYRKPRFSNRKGKMSGDGFAPSVRNRRDRQADIFRDYYSVIPITEAVFEMGQFDTQLLAAMEEGNPAPEGTDYQHGPRYGTATLREAVFSRDGYTCICCGRNAFADGAILHVHHLGFKTGDHSNRMTNLATVCEKCHTSANHKQGGKLYDLTPKLKTFKGATFMTAVRFNLFRELEATVSDVVFHMTYGAATKEARRELGVKKSHVNDAWAMGRFHPARRTDTRYFRKRRRNNRILEKFYDAKYLDTRDGAKKSGQQLSCNRTKRNISRDNSGNLRPYRGCRISKGRRSIRTQRYPVQPGDRILAEGKICLSRGMHCNGTRVMTDAGRSVAIKKIRLISYAGGWVPA